MAICGWSKVKFIDNQYIAKYSKRLKGTFWIDPGQHTACTLWGDGYIKTYYYNCKQRITKNLNRAMFLLRANFHSVVSSINIPLKVVGIEGVQFIDSVRSKASAEDLTCLGYIVGMYYEMLIPFADTMVVLKPSIWKGQLDAKQVKNIVIKTLHCNCQNTHVYHSTLMGLSVKGGIFDKK